MTTQERLVSIIVRASQKKKHIGMKSIRNDLILTKNLFTHLRVGAPERPKKNMTPDYNKEGFPKPVCDSLCLLNKPRKKVSGFFLPYSGFRPFLGWKSLSVVILI